MFYEKKYLQFNDLVFDGYDMVSGSDEPLQYKGSSTARSYGHGSYRAFKSDYLYVSERQVNMTITLKTKKIPCDYRQFYVQFAEQELGKPGRLWAIKNNTIIWAYAAVNNMRPVNTGKRGEVVWDIEFVIPGGVWHKAGKAKTFVLPYDVCSLMECKGFEEYDPCASAKGSLEPCQSCYGNRMYEALRDRCDCCCDELQPEMALCYHTDILQSFYGCETAYQFVYDCEAAEKFSTNKALGQKLCVEDACEDNIIAGNVYSDTDIPTEEMTITLIGDMKSPAITINDNTNVIEGEYSGTLTIHASGDVYYQPCDSKYCEPELLDPRVWIVPNGNGYGWTLKPQLNRVIVHMNACCSKCGLACAYIDHEGITT